MFIVLLVCYLLLLYCTVYCTVLYIGTLVYTDPVYVSLAAARAGTAARTLSGYAVCSLALEFVSWRFKTKRGATLSAIAPVAHPCQLNHSIRTWKWNREEVDP